MSGLAGLGARLRSGAETSRSLVERALAAAERSTTGAFVAVQPESALAAAAAADRELAGGRDRGPLHGIPVAVKDNIDVAGYWTRCGTPGLGHHLAERDAEVVGRLRAAGAVVVGKTRTHELAWGMITPGCRNPRDPNRITGGSSGGSAAAVAEGIVPLALGTDTGGSVRNPAALCGVVGVKLEAGAVPMTGIAPLAPTQDCAGVFATSTDDCAAALAALAIPPRSGEIRAVGVISDRWAQRVQPEVAAALADSVEVLRSQGIEVVDVAVRHAELAPAASYVIMLAESAHEWFPATGVGDEVRDLLRLGANVRRGDYDLALSARSAIRAGLDEALRRVDALLLPGSPVVAPPIGAKLVECAGREVPVAAAFTAMTALASVTGAAAVSVPAPVDGLPVGVQCIASSTGAALHCAELLHTGSCRAPS
ncbi:amidohydrolase [Saccharopolyspora subtropica]|uniref:Amidohydrolase n=1 Tax=Saccharopolyspora thermophila TaxID=89367 RepID=A0A917NCR2_9PSEU|nr:amidase [Saccharopolyspora subtropica]GGI88679.1 amidohydrolase [Saccharopolyspora subtropica]